MSLSSRRALFISTRASSCRSTDGALPQAVRLPLSLRDRLADLERESLHLHVVGAGLASKRELVPLALAAERTARAAHRRGDDFRRLECADDGALGPVGLVLADVLHRLEVADLLEARVGIELLEHLLDPPVIGEGHAAGQWNRQRQCTTMQCSGLRCP